MENNPTLPELELGYIEFPVDDPIETDNSNQDDDSQQQPESKPQIEDQDPTPADPIIDPIEQNQEPESESNEGDSEESTLSDEELNELKTRHFKVAQQLGYLDLSEDYKFDGDLEKAYQEDYQNKLTKIRDYLVDQIPPQGKEIMEYLLNGGQNITEFLTVEREQLDIESLDVTTESGAEKIIRDYFSKKGIDESSANYAIEGYKDSGKLQDHATQIKTAEVDRLKQEKQAKAQQELENQKVEAQRIEKYTSDAADFVRNTEWQPTKKQEVFTAMFSKIEYGGEQKLYSHALAEEIFKNPKAAAILTDFLLQYDTQKREFDLSRFQAVGSTQTIRQVENNLDSLFKTPKSSSTEVKKDEWTWDDVRPATTADYEQLKRN